MEFECLKPKITKDFIFSKGINQESIMQHYTGINVADKKLHLSPFRSDHKVTVSLYKSRSGILYLHDFATNEHINCFEVVMRLYDCNYYKALDIIAEDFGLVNNSKSSFKVVPPKIVETIKETDTCKIDVQIKDFTKEELDWWNDYGISYKILKKYHVYSVKHVFLNGELKFSSTEKCPIFGYYFGKNKIDRWKIYFPQNKNAGIRFLNNLSGKKLQGYKQLSDKGNLLVITKSLKDCMSLSSFNISSVAPSSESTFCTKEQIEEFKKRFSHILVIYDQDKAGKANMAKIRRQFPELNYYVIPNRFNSKDFSDLVKNYGRNEVEKLIRQFMSNYKFK